MIVYDTGFGAFLRQRYLSLSVFGVFFFLNATAHLPCVGALAESFGNGVGHATQTLARGLV